jgi:hypothetical protein
MNGYCLDCGVKGKVNTRGRCLICSNKAKQKGGEVRVLKMILKLRVKDES